MNSVASLTEGSARFGPDCFLETVSQSTKVTRRNNTTTVIAIFKKDDLELEFNLSNVESSILLTPDRTERDTDHDFSPPLKYEMSDSHDVTKFIGDSKFLMYGGVALAGGLAAGAIAHHGMGKCKWAQKLKKPCWAPPPVISHLASLVSVILLGWATYAGISAAADNQKLMINIFFGLVIALALLWAFLFYQLHNLNLAAIVSALAALALLVLMYFLWQVNRVAAAYLLPVLAWLIYSAIVSFKIAALNPEKKHGKKHHKKDKHSDSDSSDDSESDESSSDDSSSSDDESCSDDEDHKKKSRHH